MHPATIITDALRTLGDHARRLRVAPDVTSAEIRQRLEPYTFARHVPLVVAMRDVVDMLQSWTLHASHPRYFGLFVPGVHDAGVWGDALAALYNPQLGAWWHAPAANEIERHTLRFLADVIGFECEAAHFTSGGSEANLTALLAAIATAYPAAVADGVGEGSARGAVYISSQAHHSIQKAVRIAGLGTRVLRVIPCNATHQMDIAALRATVGDDVAAGRTPIMIVGTVGTTTAGAIDDLAAIADVAREGGAWFHVDAAWGGAAAFSEQLQPYLRGIERADSLTWDAHKWLSVPMGAGMFFCRRAGVLRTLFDVEAAYVPEETAEGEDLYLRSLQWSRRFIGLKVFFTLTTIGRGGVAARIERQLDVAEVLRQRLTSAGWVIVNRSPLPVVCFTHPSLVRSDAMPEIARAVAAGGRAWLSAATLPEGRVLRACITHDDTTPADVAVLCEELERALGMTVGRAGT